MHSSANSRWHFLYIYVYCMSHCLKWQNKEILPDESSETSSGRLIHKLWSSYWHFCALSISHDIRWWTHHFKKNICCHRSIFFRTIFFCLINRRTRKTVLFRCLSLIKTKNKQNWTFHCDNIHKVPGFLVVNKKKMFSISPWGVIPSRCAEVLLTGHDKRSMFWWGL